jgi:hypothetical protein
MPEIMYKGAPEVFLPVKLESHHNMPVCCDVKPNQKIFKKIILYTGIIIDMGHFPESNIF